MREAKSRKYSATGAGGEPSARDASAPACVKRKMLSTKSAEHVLALDVAEVLGDGAEPGERRRARARGDGSFIWPYTSAAFEPPSRAITSGAFVSSSRGRRSLPSRVRSPTPAKTEKPPCAFAMLRKNDRVSRFVFADGRGCRCVRRSVAAGSGVRAGRTLMPVTSISMSVLWSTKGGASR